jgi:hypothetical protein
MASRSIIVGSTNSAVKRITGPRANGLESEPVLSTTPEVQTPNHDFVARSEGTIWIFTPLSHAASEFLSEHIQEDAQYFGSSLCVEHRFVYDLLIGIREHGLRAVIG